MILYFMTCDCYREPKRARLVTIDIYNIKTTDIYNSNRALLNTQLFLVSYNLAIVRGVRFSVRNPHTPLLNTV